MPKSTKSSVTADTPTPPAKGKTKTKAKTDTPAPTATPAKGKDKAAPTVTATPTAKAPKPEVIAARAFKIIGGLSQGHLEILGHLHDGPLNPDEMLAKVNSGPADQPEGEKVHDALKAAKLITGDKSRKFVPSERGKVLWSLAQQLITA